MYPYVLCYLLFFRDYFLNFHPPLLRPCSLIGQSDPIRSAGDRDRRLGDG